MSDTGRASNAPDSPEEPRVGSPGAGPGAMDVLRHARDQFTQLTGLAPESVSSFERTQDGWAMEIEVLELARVPDTMSLIASYEVDVTADGELAGYRRVRRYERGRADPQRPTH
ncbi:gas vesicle protein [Streptomyces sp. RY43-2]|uniref:Gas vesicle protein n=1 Tax=Streptomyces macrolidinus TaxID=2952607 RepID=A0ABT0ZIR5_9ACTN|nr:gas vesicle protein [Streptomyces macrolidinus]MCN9243484.1 gas vesicle protein [Streptomyces macrolidinus]